MILSTAGSRPVALLLLLFTVAFLPRMYMAQTIGWGWDGPRTFNLVNFDEGGSCRAALNGFAYPPFIGYQTIALARLTGDVPPAAAWRDPVLAKAWCHSPPHIVAARSWSALLGALTVPLLVLAGWQLRPDSPGPGLVAGALLALSGFHISQSFSGTVDAASTFFIYLFLCVAIAAFRGSRPARLASAPLLLAALASKYWVFVLLSPIAIIGLRLVDSLLRGFSRGGIVLAMLGATAVFGLVSNSDFFRPWGYLMLLPWYFLLPWRRLHPLTAVVLAALPVAAELLSHWPRIAAYTTGALEGRFGSGYGAIGWHKWLRNPLDLLIVLIVGLGLPAFTFLPAGIKGLCRDPDWQRVWPLFFPLLAFALFMLFLSPVTYYRHYLPLLPAAALLSALGIWQVTVRWRLLVVSLSLIWSSLLALDLVQDFHRDPRIALREWYDETQPERVYTSFYVNPPPSDAPHYLFRPALAAPGSALFARSGYVILSENWYDTAFANELNGPLTGDLTRLVKTTPADAQFYRDALAGLHPNLAVERVYPVLNWMPEQMLHKAAYGTFQLFVGDIVVLRIVPSPLESSL